MPQQSLYPIRQGLSVPRGENLQTAEIFCEGGLDLTQSVLETRAGFASQLVNFEVSLTGGYRRISGYQKFSSTVVPGQGKLIGSFVYFPGYVLAARQDASDATKYNIYYGNGTSWTRINPTTTSQATAHTHTNTTLDNINTTGLIPGQPISGTGIQANTVIQSVDSPTSLTMSLAATGTATITATFNNPLTYTTGMVLQRHSYNWTGTYIMAIADGTNRAYTWNGTTMVILRGTGSPANPNFVAEFAGYLFLSGYSSNFSAISISSPFNASDWLPVDGAAEFVMGDTVSQMRSWRQQLILFGKNSIYKLIGNSTDPTAPQPFTLEPITDKIGCEEGRTVQEINGDLLFLAQDGLRTISGTIKIGDTEIGSVSRPIQRIVSEINPTTTPCHSLVVKNKTQYRLFFPDADLGASSAPGIIAGIRRFRDGHEDWEFGRLHSIKPACCDNGYWQTNGDEYVIHGGYDGYVYRQEEGGTFDGSAINEIYKTVPLEFGDRTIRKTIQRATLYITVDTIVPTIQLQLIYDLGAPNTIQPGSITLTNVGSNQGVIWDEGALWDDGSVWDTGGAPLFRQSVQGSGFLAQLQFTSPETTVASYTVQGFALEYYPAGRR